MYIKYMYTQIYKLKVYVYTYKLSSSGEKTCRK